MLFCIGVSLNLAAQNSSKTKAAEKLYEKGAVQNNISVVNTANINTDQLEFSPSFYQNGIVFTTARRQRGPRDGNIDETFFELSFSEFDGNGMPIAAEPFSVEMNSQVHEGPVTFSRDSRTIFFTRNNLIKGATIADSNGKVRLKVFKATKGRFDWEDVQELPFNSDEYDVMHPSLSPDGKLLYFTSNMPGSLGGTDIWVVAKDGDNYGPPSNLGPKVNSAKNEAFPFIHESGTLFFASEGLPGNGGYDLFKCDVVGQKWDNVSNLGMPFNSSKDDLGLIMNSAGTRGYFTSSRTDGLGKDDIYKFEVGDGFLTKSAPDINALIRVYDKQSNNRIEGAAIRVFERSADGILSGGDLYDVVLMPNRTGSNELTMKLVPKDAALMGNPDLLTNNQGESPYMMSPDKQYIFFVSKDGYMTNEMVYSTTGRKGELIVEVPLDVKRCANVVGKVVDSKTGGLLPNTSLKVSSTCEAGEQMLVSDANGRFEYCLPMGCNYTISGSRTGYADGNSTVTVPGNNLADITTTISLTPLGGNGGGVTTNPRPPRNEVFIGGATIVLDKIYYDFNKSAIRTGAARELDALAAIMMRYPSMEIELSSHTDSRGTAEYNSSLSLKRAESAKRYLVSRGVSPSKITALGRGESQPRNDCFDGVACSEEEHQYNRRTEARVIRVNEAVEVQYGDKGPEVIDRRRGRN